MKSLSVPVLTEPVEPFELADRPSGCDPVAKPGVVAFQKFVMENVGVGGWGGIIRDCSVGKPSHHHLGRAWDWSVLASNPEQSAAAQAVIDWLLAPDQNGNEAAMYRRVGLVYIIWNKQIYTSLAGKWVTYQGTNPHTDHVHFSFGVPGANAQTSFFRWIGTPGFEPLVETTIDVPIVGAAESNLVAAVAGAVLGAIGGYMLGGRIAHITTKIGAGARAAARRL